MKPLAENIWVNGEVVPWAEARIHVMSHALHYGTSMFEGVRVYDTPRGPCGFRLTDHIARLYDSCRMYGFRPPYDLEALVEACRAIVRANGLRSAYIRPIAFLGECGMGVTPAPQNLNVDVAIAAFPWGAYLGEEGLAKGVDVCISSWARYAPNTVPTGAKAGGNYLSGYLIGREATSRGFAEGIALGTDGRLSEGAGENLFVVKDGRILTPPAAASILVGITRDTVFKLAADAGIPIVEQILPREALYVADEVFFSGTAAEITPVRSIDGIETRCAGPGPVTRRLQALFNGLFTGETPDRHGWLEPIADTTAAAPAGSRPMRRTAARPAYLDLDEAPPVVATRPRTLFDKVWDAHVVEPEGEDRPALLYIDLHLVHEVTSPQAFSELDTRGLTVRRPTAPWPPWTTPRRRCRRGRTGCARTPPRRRAPRSPAWQRTARVTAWSCSTGKARTAAWCTSSGRSSA